MTESRPDSHLLEFEYTLFESDGYLYGNTVIIAASNMSEAAIIIEYELAKHIGEVSLKYEMYCNEFLLCSFVFDNNWKFRDRPLMCLIRPVNGARQ